MPRYTSIFATSEHQKIKSMHDLKMLKKARKYSEYYTMGLFLDNVCIGYGSLCLCKESPNSVETSSTKILDKFRKQGHGIQLYRRLIKTAKKLGASRIYSDASLNDLSEKMWSEKLPKYFQVFKIASGPPSMCNCCKKVHCHERRYYIDLEAK